jgi:hypothetical protein
MRIQSHIALAPTLAIFALVFSPPLGHAEYHELKTPSVARPKEYSETDYKKIVTVLERNDCKFLGGSALNSMTSLRYASDTIPLNMFIEALARCPNVTVSVKFYRPTPGAPECDWTVTHEAHRMRFVVRINLESKRIKLEDLYLPPVKSEKDTSKRAASS